MALNNTINSVSLEIEKLKRSVHEGIGKLSRAVTEQAMKAVRNFSSHVTRLAKRSLTMTKEDTKMALMTLALATVMMLVPGLFRHVKLTVRLPVKRGSQLPRGSLGLPFLGEDIILKAQQQTFYDKRRKRYGDLFRTHLFGYPSIVVTDPEAAKFVLDQSALFKQLALPEVGRLLGSKFLGYSNHRVHSRLRRVMQSPLLALHNSIPYIEVLALGLMYSWEGRTINTLQQLHHYTFDVATHFIIGAQPKPEVESLRRACNNLFGGVRAWPISLIGTNFWWAKRGRRQACAIIDKIIARRRSEGRPYGDILGQLMDAEDDRGARLTPAEIHDNILTLLFDARDTAAALLTWVLKNLSDNPSLLAQVTEEHEKIRRKKLPPDSVPLQWSDIKDMPLSWADIKEMQLTLRVIKETLRLGNIIEFSYREAVEDVDFEGCFFPKGWRVLVLHANFHLNPDYFPDPMVFDPSRFQVINECLNVMRLACEEHKLSSACSRDWIFNRCHAGSSAKARNIYSLWQRCSRLPRKGASAVGSFYIHSPLHHQIQVDHSPCCGWVSQQTSTSTTRWHANFCDPETSRAPCLPQRFLYSRMNLSGRATQQFASFSIIVVHPVRKKQKREKRHSPPSRTLLGFQC